MTIIDQIDKARHQFRNASPRYPWALVLAKPQHDLLFEAAKRLHRFASSPRSALMLRGGTTVDDRVTTYMGMNLLLFISQADAAGPMIASEGMAQLLLDAGLVNWG